MGLSTYDWVVIAAFLAFVIGDGLRKARGNRTAEDYLLASRGVPWWAMGLSIMATQASAVTFVGTTGQGYYSGTGFVQFYYFLPLAMLVLCVTAVPFFHRERVFTAYEYLERRFDRKTRACTSMTFLVLRCLSLGGILSAPAFVLAEFSGQSFLSMVLVMGGVAIAYTSLGGLKAVISTDVKQMGVMVVALGVLFFIVVDELPDDVGLAGAVRLADAAGRIELANWSFDPTERYTIWSALLGGLVIFLAYFGTDQSQVQRYLAGRSLRDKRGALLLNAVAKVPFQLGILLLGVLFFVWSLFMPVPMVFHSETAARANGEIEGHAAITAQFETAQRRAGASGQTWLASGDESDRDAFVADVRRVTSLRGEGKSLRGAAELSEPSAKNYVVPWFMKHRLPRWGLVGLLLAGILAAALSSIDSELNALATVGAIDILRLKPGVDDARIIRATRVLTLLFGALAVGFATTLEGVGALIEYVNMIGSWFYGSLLGVFLLAWWDRRAHGTGVVVGLVVGIGAAVASEQVAESGFGVALPWLFKNTVGVVATCGVGFILSRVLPAPPSDQ